MKTGAKINLSDLETWLVALAVRSTWKDGRLHSKKTVTGVCLEPTAGRSVCYPTDGSGGKVLGWYLFILVHLRHFGRSQHAAGLLSPPLILHQVRILVCKTRNAFWHELPSKSTKQAQIPRIASKEKSSSTQGLNFGSILARLFEAYSFSVLTMNWSCNRHP